MLNCLLAHRTAATDPSGIFSGARRKSNSRDIFIRVSALQHETPGRPDSVGGPPAPLTSHC